MGKGKKHQKSMLNINSPIFDDLFDRRDYTGIIVDNKFYSIENEKKKFHDNFDFDDTLYLDYTMNKCNNDCQMCNLHKLYDIKQEKSNL